MEFADCSSFDLDAFDEDIKTGVVKDNNDDENTSIDDWKPRKKYKGLCMSEWRELQNNGDFDRNPSLDDLRKIKSHLNKNCPDADILKMYGINAETLIAIKRNYFCPVDGIKNDFETKFFNKYKYLEESIRKIKNSLDFLGDHIFEDEKIRKNFRKKAGIIYRSPEKDKAETIESDDIK
jgi:hypothetical protein